MTLWNDIRDGIKALFWVISPAYTQVLKTVLPPCEKDTVRNLFDYSKDYYPYMNREFFPGYLSGLKAVAEDGLEVQIHEVDLSDDVLGAFYPSQKPTIFLNRKMPSFLKFSTLGHEMSHVIVNEFLGAHREEHAIVKHRYATFHKDLGEKEEALADVLTSFGSYPRPALEKYPQQQLKKDGFGLGDFFKALWHFKCHYPESTRRLPFSSVGLLNLALIMHYYRLRQYVYKTFDI